MKRTPVQANQMVLKDIEIIRADLKGATDMRIAESIEAYVVQIMKNLNITQTSEVAVAMSLPHQKNLENQAGNGRDTGGEARSIPFVQSKEKISDNTNSTNKDL